MSRAALEAEIGRWGEVGLTPRLWWRDDDAVDETPALERLTKLTGDRGIAVLLAVIPAFATDALANHVALYRHLDPCVHGWAHENHEPEGVKRAELGAGRPLDEVIGDVARGAERLQVLFGAHLLPVLVPPWNRMREDLAPRLAEAGIEAFSTFTHQLIAPDMQANTHVDVMDWASRGGKPADMVLAELAAALAVARAGGGYEVGVLTHHLVHDAAAWEACEVLARLDGVSWVRFPGSTLPQHDNAGVARQR
jgi:hypothetical protein